MIGRVAMAAGVVAAAACNPAGRGTLTAHWAVATDSASVTVPATATWCPGPARFDIRGFAGDTAVGLAVYPADTTAVDGSFPVLVPGAPVQIRPAAAVALRWVGKVDIQGWWGDSGSVTLTSGALAGLSGTGEVRLVSNLGPDSVAPLTLSFRGLRVKTDTLCDAPQLPVAVPVDSAAVTAPAPGVD